MAYDISNEQVLQLLFGNQWQYAHVTSFPDDPSAIPNDRKALCWAGDYYYKQPLQPNTNQFFSVSLFNHIDGKSRRRKSHFIATYVIGLDDVNEKLPPEMVARLPRPTFKMHSSKGSEQWFYKLTFPETNQNRVDNLLDQLIKNGLAPDGNDPGMKGVSRYLRLVGGVNTKAKRIIENGGVPFQCVVTEWNPELSYSMEDLAEPFNVDLDVKRRDVRTSGTIDIPNHPILKYLDIKSELGAGKYDITCPWIDDHTDNDNSGSAVFTNDDGSIGFHCHHGHCESKTAGDLLANLDENYTGIKAQYNSWRNAYQSMSAFNSVNPLDFTKEQPITLPADYDFMDTTEAPATYDFMDASPVKKSEPVTNLVDYQLMMNAIRVEHPQSNEKLMKCEQLLHAIDPLPYPQQLKWRDEIQHEMGWSKSDLQKSVTSFRKTWYDNDKSSLEFYREVFFVTSLNQFYHPMKDTYYTVEAFHNTYNHLDEVARKTALEEAKTRKVDAVDYVPGKPQIFEQGNKEYVNTWTGELDYGSPGNASAWLNHWKVLGWEEHMPHHLRFMANTIRKPETKINWALLMGGREGTGKDFLLYPLVMSMGENSGTAHGDELLGQFNEYLKNKKHVHFNEVEMGDHAENRAIANKLKPIIAAPPERIPINMKGMRRMTIKNVANVTISSNSYQPVYIDRGSRRYYMAWSDLQTRDGNDNMLPEWQDYWVNLWNWMLDESEGGAGGWRACVHYLVHKVDLDDFNPRVAPPVTDYMREVQHMSKSPLEIEIEELIMNNVGAFACDLITNQEALATVQMHTSGSRLNANSLTKVLNSIGCKSGMRCSLDGRQVRLVAVRKTNYYAKMSAQGLADVYVEQHEAMRQQGNIVKITR